MLQLASLWQQMLISYCVVSTGWTTLVGKENKSWFLPWNKTYNLCVYESQDVWNLLGWGNIRKYLMETWVVETLEHSSELQEGTEKWNHKITGVTWEGNMNGGDKAWLLNCFCSCLLLEEQVLGFLDPPKVFYFNKAFFFLVILIETWLEYYPYDVGKTQFLKPS